MFSRSLFWKLFLPIGLMLIVCAIVAALYLPVIIRRSAEQDAVAAGRETVSQFIKLRQYYTENVVAKVNGRGGFSVSFDHHNAPNVLPLPATMIHELSEMFGVSGTMLKLYSPYPFPHRRGRVMDQFAQDAWAFLSAHPDQVFYRTENVDARTIVRVAIADRMTVPACVNCHNSVAGSPKTDWVLGDVRGVLEVDSSKQLESGQQLLLKVLVMLGLILILIAVFLRIFFQRSIVRPLHAALDVAQVMTTGNAAKLTAIDAISNGDLESAMTTTKLPEVDADTIGDDEIGRLLSSVLAMGATQVSLDHAFGKMRTTLLHNRSDEANRDWLNQAQNELNRMMRGEHELAELAASVLSYLVQRLGAGSAALYLFDDSHKTLNLCASYAMVGELTLRERFALGQGLSGQAALERKVLTMMDLPSDYLPIGSALGQAAPHNVMAIPLLQADNLIAVMELASFKTYSPTELELLTRTSESIAIAFIITQSRQRTQALLEQATQQAEELRVQQEELQQSNEELEERAELLEQQRELIRLKNQEVEQSSSLLQRKATELERISAYKSEFLANMSHELRTPLNSMLILSSLLQQNKEGQLSAKQVDYAATIYGAGKDLLNLINDILDLSKIEAGRLELNYEDVRIADLTRELSHLFQPLADHQQLQFQIAIAPGTPEQLSADSQRLQQILKNLLANAFKFTPSGKISLSIQVADPKSNPLSVPALALAVTDSGIGIAAEHQEQIFHAFQQADGSTSRKFGGTGLGLSISRQLAQHMGGDIKLVSALGQGSVFTVYLPLQTDVVDNTPIDVMATTTASALVVNESQTSTESLAPVTMEDDRDQARPGERTILIIEDDQVFAGILRDTVREHGFLAIIARNGESGLMLATRFIPDAIILDVMLPHMDGWGVMRSIKDNPLTRAIPVHFITCLEDRHKALHMGAIGFASKPLNKEQLDQVIGVIESAIDNPVKRLLVVEDNEVEAKSIASLLQGTSLEIVIARSGHRALELLHQQRFDCMVLDLGLTDMSGFEVLDHLKNEARHVPVIIHSGRTISEVEERRLRDYTDSIIIKGVQSPERLLNEVSLFLHLVESKLPQEKQKMIQRALDKEALFEKRKVLLVDDDMRNIFSLSSVLSAKGLTIVEATNGVEALARLDAQTDIDIVLMDIMMPEMDGYEAMRRIRKSARYARVPVIALTAKAMQSDLQLCLDAGADDYISKPIDIEKLFSLMRVWLYQRRSP